MPRGDRTGPFGAGPMTGRGLGSCRGHETPGFANPTLGRGMGWRHGWGGGFGWRHRFFATPTQEETLQALKSEADWLKGQLDALNKQIEELEK
ncbi:MAG: DUF5320 domain-containing protein [Anaerolineales bacterium]|nr:DUF5320 domain-containing protein [Anaerolineales bacterium]